jgi:phytoene/squalene synthetase
MITEWMRQVQAQRQAATAQLDALGGLLAILRTADPDDRAEVYKQPGLRLTYDRETNTVLAETQPTSSMCVEYVSEARLDHYAHALHLRERLRRRCDQPLCPVAERWRCLRRRRSLGRAAPLGAPPSVPADPAAAVITGDRIGGLIHEYAQVA